MNKLKLRTSENNTEVDGVEVLFASLSKKFGRLSELSTASSDQVAKFKKVDHHLGQELSSLDSDEQHQFAQIFDEFRGVLGEFLQQGVRDPRLEDIFQFIQSLLDSVLGYLDKKNDLQKVGRIEADDFMKKISKTQKSIADMISTIARETEELKPAMEARIARALEFTSLMEKDDNSPKVPSFNYDLKPASNLQNLFNLKKTLNSPRETSVRDYSKAEETTRSPKSKSRDIQERPSTIEHQLVLEQFKNQIIVLQSELDRREGTL